MIPLSIEIHNFGAIPFANIDFSNIDTAVVVGKNGYGKSTAFVWAPLWILYGVTKNDCAVDDMVRRGT
ncbi:MAG: AAA family ATPase, partial [Desulfotomaculaceae bacterium]|nr:AAA family ATPase [Desulfotomaculaceae bacterium]